MKNNEYLLTPHENDKKDILNRDSVGRQFLRKLIDFENSSF